jgi:hypothetical protein
MFPQRLKPRDLAPVAARLPFVPLGKKPCPDGKPIGQARENGGKPPYSKWAVPSTPMMELGSEP